MPVPNIIDQTLSVIKKNKIPYKLQKVSHVSESDDYIYISYKITVNYNPVKFKKQIVERILDNISMEYDGDGYNLRDKNHIVDLFFVKKPYYYSVKFYHSKLPQHIVLSAKPKPTTLMLLTRKLRMDNLIYYPNVLNVEPRKARLKKHRSRSSGTTFRSRC
jgi:hypothetical protein